MTAMARIHLEAIAAALLLACAAPAQDPPPVDPGLPDRLRELDDMLEDRRMEQDFQAISVIQKLCADPAAHNPKDADRIVKALGQVFFTGRVRPPDKSVLYREAADALGKFGEDGARYLRKVLEHSRLKGREFAELRAHMLLALGRTQDLRQVEYLLERALRSPDDEVMAAAGEALGHYTDMPLKLRREVVKDLISRLGEWHMKATAIESTDPNAPIDFTPQNARRTLDRIEGKWNATLTALTGERHTSAPDWQHWYNKNKDWEPPR